MSLCSRCLARTTRRVGEFPTSILRTSCTPRHHGRFYSTPASEPDLKETFRAAIPAKKELLAQVKAQGSKVIGEIQVQNAIGGMRGLKAMLWEASVLDPNTGITFHGKSIAECQSLLPKPPQTGSAMLPEAMFWFLLTGQIPSESQTRAFSRHLASKASLTKIEVGTISALPGNTHPMIQMSIGVSAMARNSAFATAYARGLSKSDYWEKTFDDAVTLIAKLPALAAIVYRKSYAKQSFEATPVLVEADPEQDWSYNFAAMLGYGGEENTDFQDLLRLYLALHGDHEGGNVSAHATHLVASALSDPFLAYSAGLQGLAGPLHGLAAQEVLRWILRMKDAVPEDPSHEDVKAYLWLTLKSGQVVPGYGHAVLRKTDPRFEALMDFAKSRPGIMDDPVFRLVKLTSEVAPGVLMEHGKTKNPYPNVDSISGVLFHHYGLRETLFYTVIFGVSRALGPMAQVIWDRALGLPIERPKSINLQGMLDA